MSTTTAAPRSSEATPDPAALCRFLDGEHHGTKEEVRQRLADFGVSPPGEQLPREEYRAQVMEWMLRLAETGQPAMLFPESAGGQGDPGAAISAFEMLGHGDLSLLVKCGVQFGLFGGAVQHLGNEEHHRKYLADVASAKLLGCFAMTESARKDYIGNAARDGHMAVVFAQLEVGGDEHGVHALLVPIRDQDGNVLDGVTIEDDGDKLGLQGVDNGRISFDRVRVPRENLLDRYATVGSDGLYGSPIENVNRRFFTTIGTLIQGRVSVSGAALSATKSALTIAVRYAARRRQFGPPDGDEEALLIDYRIHQRRLFPPLATTYALHFAQRELVAELHRAFTEEDHDDEAQRRLEAQAAGV